MITFKEAENNDIQLIRTLAERSWKKAYLDIISLEQVEYMLNKMYSTVEIASHLQNPNYFYFIVNENSTPAGFIGYENHYEPKTTKLHRIYLLEEFKGKGLGKKAIDFLKGKVSTAGDKQIILNVNKNNSAKEIYESQGFTVYNEDIFDIGKGYVMDDYLMKFEL
ncbi:GNAT family N-acetyltransferase [Chryseobacterium sp. MP_3.2]|uniref:GNAT family N-acetyltransferase n=1 Tax=Chryseobacterium sp. MP_3.2 TaxID=3071712 RepID=UPI002E006C0D|nr:ribosomal protein S18 acetylase RimI-like enzyme [Chryseobacterium sp. MP_3.2]